MKYNISQLMIVLGTTLFLVACDLPCRLRIKNCSTYDILIVHPSLGNTNYPNVSEKIEKVPAGCMSSWLKGWSLYGMLLINSASNRVEYFSYDYDATAPQCDSDSVKQKINVTIPNTKLQFQYLDGCLSVVEYKSPLWVVKYDSIQPEGFPLMAWQPATYTPHVKIENHSGGKISIAYKETATSDSQLMDVLPGKVSSAVVVTDICQRCQIWNAPKVYEALIIDWAKERLVRFKIPSASQDGLKPVIVRYFSPEHVTTWRDGR